MLKIPAASFIFMTSNFIYNLENVLSKRQTDWTGTESASNFGPSCLNIKHSRAYLDSGNCGSIKV